MADTLKTGLVRRHFTASADSYAAHAVVQPRVVDRLLTHVQRLQLRREGAILDLGTGTGALASAYRSQVNPSATVVGCDLAQPMCQQAALQVPGLLPVACDVRSLPFASHQFALAMSASVYQWVDDLPLAFAEVARILQPGGWFAVALFGQKTLYELKTAYREARRLTGSAGDDHLQHFPSIDEVQSALVSVPGFQLGEMEQGYEIEHHANVRALLKGLKAIGAHNASTAQPKGLASRRVMQTMIETYEQVFSRNQGVPATYEVLIATAQKTASA